MIIESIDWALEKRVNHAGYVRNEVIVEGVRLSYLIKEGDHSLPPLVFVHGISSKAIHWHDVLVSMKNEDYTIICLDLPGHGKSEKPPGVLSPAKLYNYFAKMIDALVPEGAILLGNSLGGSMVLKYSVLGQVPLKGLIAVSPAVGVLDDSLVLELKRILNVKNYREGQELMQRMCAKPPLGAKLMAWIVAQGAKRPAVQDLLSQVSPLDFEPPFKTFPHELMEAYPPTVVMWGKRDEVIPQSSLSWLKEYFSEPELKSKIKFLEPAMWSHTPFVDDPHGFTVQVQDAVQGFLAALPEAQVPAFDPDAFIASEEVREWTGSGPHSSAPAPFA